MRPTHPGGTAPREFRRRVERLDRLPLRPATVRHILDGQPDPPDGEPLCVPRLAPGRGPLDLDPGWVNACWPNCPAEPGTLLSEHPWWTAVSDAAAEALERLWRHSVAVSCVARRLALEAKAADSDRLARAGLLVNLGLWAIAAVDPERLSRLLDQPEPSRRRELTRTWLGTHAAEIGRRLACSWGVDPLLVDAATLPHAEGIDLDCYASDPARLVILNRAYQWAELTPWALVPLGGRGPGRTDARIQILVAEVQARCTGRFIDPFPPPEERLLRSNLRLRHQVASLLREQAATQRLLHAIGQTRPTSSLEAWTEQASQAWSGEPGVLEARVIASPMPGTAVAPLVAAEAAAPDLILPIQRAGQQVAQVHLWTDRRTGGGLAPLPPAVWAAWGAWAAQVAEHDQLCRRFEGAMEMLRSRAEQEGPARRSEQLDALAEFAAGAGHELNNPLAVILGRAQLMLVREADESAARSLRAIVSQAQRASRILRDLMYVARPPQPRPRRCQPQDIVRACMRDLAREAEARGVRLQAESAESLAPIWADPDPLRHLVETLLRNALEATPAGGLVRLETHFERDRLSWIVEDTGRGLSGTEFDHLFDPFFCGRQAGRGLGLGLPRIARFLNVVGGHIRWRSAPGRGSIFHVSIPVVRPTAPGGSEPLDGTASGRDSSASP